MPRPRKVRVYAPPAEISFAEAIDAQIKHCQALARQMDARGYAVMLFTSGPRNVRDASHIWSAFGGALTSMARAWFDAPTRKRRRPIWVFVTYEPIPSTRWVDCKLRFKCDIPKRIHYQPIHAALEMLSYDRKSNRGNSAVLERAPSSDDIQYMGNGKTALQIFLRVLEMPQHKSILLTGDSDAEL